MNLKNLVLRPNCLLTKSPLVFVPGPRSLLFYKKPFGILPDFLFEHGYQTVVLPLPFQGIKSRQQDFKNWLMANPTKTYHLVAYDRTYFEFKDIISCPQILSCTFISTSASLPSTGTSKAINFVTPAGVSTQLTAPLNFRIHQFFCWIRNQPVISYAQTFSNSSRQTLDRFLDHCIKLAENEFHA